MYIYHHKAMKTFSSTSTFRVQSCWLQLGSVVCALCSPVLLPLAIVSV
jgi:hypothetical protein